MSLPSQQQKNKKKRVVLGEIQNFVPPSNVTNRNSKQNLEKQKQKKKPNRKVKKPVEKEDANVEDERENKSVNGEDDDAGIDVNAKSDDPQMCGAYVSGMMVYEYNQMGGGGGKR
ncbi:putative cyclin-A3-1 [Forsythia ovata]|uniref:Cyclin-A3-1 n=1 Tax=Forsythia ovata TaxID=205694 RepID=A0ABD1VJ16_9LAMI